MEGFPFGPLGDGLSLGELQNTMHVINSMPHSKSKLSKNAMN